MLITIVSIVLISNYLKNLDIPFSILYLKYNCKGKWKTIRKKRWK